MKLITRLSKCIKRIPKRLEMTIAEWKWHVGLPRVYLDDGDIHVLISEAEPEKGGPLFCAIYNRDIVTLEYLTQQPCFAGFEKYIFRIYDVMNDENDDVCRRLRNINFSMACLYAFMDSAKKSTIME